MSFALTKTENHVSNNVIKIFIVVLILGIIVFSFYESTLDPDKRDDEKLNFWIILLINTILTVGGFMITIAANYVVEVYSLQKIDNTISDSIYALRPNRRDSIALHELDNIFKVSEPK